MEKVRAAGGEVVPGALDPAELGLLAANDTGNATRFKTRFGHHFRFVPQLGWYAYTGTHWSAEQGQRLAHLAAREMARLIHDEATALEQRGASPRAVAALHRFAIRSGNRRSIENLLKVAEDDLRAGLDEFDRDPLLLNCRNGTLRFVKDETEGWVVRLDPHCASDMLSRITRTKYDPNAIAPLWDAHLIKMQPDEEMRDYLQRQFGYIILGHGDEQAFFVHQGRGGDGKSTTVNTIRRVLGNYAITADVRTFLAPKDASAGGGDRASPGMARLAGDFRLVSTSEPPRGSALNEGLVKAVTGGAPVVARQLREGLFEYIPRWKLVIECNALPYVPGEDHGIWRRAKLASWRIQLRRAEMDPMLETKLILRESAGILTWLVNGSLDYLNRGALAEPTAARESLEDFRRGSNTFGEWLSEFVVLDPKASVTNKALYASYCEFCTATGDDPINAKAFGRSLSNQQITTRSGPGGRTPDKRRDWLRFGARLKTGADCERAQCDHAVTGDNAGEQPDPTAIEFDEVF